MSSVNGNVLFLDGIVVRLCRFLDYSLILLKMGDMKLNFKVDFN